MSESRRGFVLIAVLWAMVGVSALSIGIALIARRASGGARNRIAERVAAWNARDCLARARATIASAMLSDSASTGDTAAWRDLGHLLATAALHQTTDCAIEMRAAGQALDVNAADSATLSRLLLSMGVDHFAADSLVDAILDWRDSDDQARPLGAERWWYIQHRLSLPRNGPFENSHELDLVRGAASAPGLDTLLGTERGRVALNEAPLPVVAALPGFTREAVALVEEHRTRRVPIADLLTFAGELSPAARDTLQSHYSDLVQLTTTTPDAWVLTSRGTSGAPPITAAIELRLLRAGSRAAIVRQRTWIE